MYWSRLGQRSRLGNINESVKIMNVCVFVVISSLQTSVALNLSMCSCFILNICPPLSCDHYQKNTSNVTLVITERNIRFSVY